MVSESTMRMYEAQLRAFFKKSKYSPDDDFLKDHKAVIKEVHSFYASLHSVKNTLNSLVIYGRSIKYSDKYLAFYSIEIDRISELLKNQTYTNEKTEKQRENWIELDELEKILEQLRDDIPAKIATYKSYKIFMRYMALFLMLRFPRRNDYVHMKIQTNDKNTSDPETNYLIFDREIRRSFFVFNNYKTFNKYGSQKFPVPDVVHAFFKKYVSTITANSKDGFLFIKSNEEKMNTNEFTKFFINFMTEKTGKKIGTTMMRHIIISDKFKVDKDELREREDLANVMGHSVIQQMTYSKS